MQGVGFRPFVCRMAARHSVVGEVDNRTDGVVVTVQCDMRTVDRFSNDILQNAPPASQIKSIEVNPVECRSYDNFSIAASRHVKGSVTEVSPDIAVCSECLEDMAKDPERIDYPFINCTNCGPRFSIISDLPYDRPSTSMKDFEMCTKCRSEYEDILDRRFHAQPVACNSCGPVYQYQSTGLQTEDLSVILKEISSGILKGESVAVKGTGGWFLMCDALNNEAVAALRKKKLRDSKPFAVMFRDISAVKRYCFLDQAEEKELKSWRRPVVILRQKESIAENVNAGLNTIGALLPYMPFHYLLFKNLSTPAIVLTSGNLSDEPIIVDDAEAEKRLMPVTGALLKYNRQIINRVDDSVVRIADNKTIMIRRSRGFVPRPVDLDLDVNGIIALGAEEKNTFCIGKGTQAIVSQHIGDLKNPATYSFFLESIDRFSRLFRFNQNIIACDLHPDYLSTYYAELTGKEFNIPVVRVQHHHAHVVSCMAEKRIDGEVIGISLDGTGYGTDGNTWGGEFMIAGLGSFRRIAHFDYVPMPGGDRAISEPWRMAFSYIYKYAGNNFDFESVPVFRKAGIEKLKQLSAMIDNNINSPLTSGAGRLFDSVAAMLDLCSETSYDAEGPMRLEAVADDRTEDRYPFTAGEVISFAETIKAIASDIHREQVPVISAKFHNTVALAVAEKARQIRKETSVSRVVLSGGVFQNRFLLEKTLWLLNRDKFRVFTNNTVPPNDGGISLGQLVAASKIVNNVS